MTIFPIVSSFSCNNQQQSAPQHRHPPRKNVLPDVKVHVDSPRHATWIAGAELTELQAPAVNDGHEPVEVP